MTEQLFSDSSLNSVTVSRGELARLLDVSMSLISELVSKGIVTERPGGRISLVDAFRGIYRWQRRAIERRGNEGIQREREGLLKAKREQAELALMKERQEVLDATAVMAAWSRIITVVRTRLLSMPTKLAGRLQGLKPGEIEAMLREEVYEAMTGLSQIQTYDFSLQSEIGVDVES